MAKPSKLNTPVVTGEPFDPIEEARDELSSMGATSTATQVTGRIYRCLPPDERNGIRQPTEFCGVVEEFVDEDFVGRNYGPGVYKLRFIVRTDKEKLKKDLMYTIGDEYARFKRPAVEPEQVQAPAANAAQNAPAGLLGMVSSIGPEKLAAWAMALKTIKEIFAPPPPPPPPAQPDYIELFKLMMANKAPNLSDAVVIKAMENLRDQQRAASPLQQLKELRELKELIKEDEPENQGDNMDIIKTALEYLPALLKANGGNYQAAGQQAAAFPMIKNMVRNDPALAQKFFDTAVKTYGQENALQLAAGFGFQATPAPAVAQNQQFTNTEEQAGDIDDLPDEGD